MALFRKFQFKLGHNSNYPKGDFLKKSNFLTHTNINITYTRLWNLFFIQYMVMIVHSNKGENCTFKQTGH
jgi:hypothetical protein